MHLHAANARARTQASVRKPVRSRSPPPGRALSRLRPRALLALARGPAARTPDDVRVLFRVLVPGGTVLQRQQLRDQKRRIRVLEKNNLAWDLKRSTAEVWLVGPRIKNLEKNNLASAQVLIFQPVKQQQLLDGDA